MVVEVRSSNWIILILEANRVVFGAAGAIEAAGKDLLSSGENWNFRRLCLRAIGNLLYENSKLTLPSLFSFFIYS
jgi:hypothetical protein